MILNLIPITSVTYNTPPPLNKEKLTGEIFRLSTQLHG